MISFTVDYEPTAAQERERMIALTRGAALDQEDENDDHRKFMASTQKRM